MPANAKHVMQQIGVVQRGEGLEVQRAAVGMACREVHFKLKAIEAEFRPDRIDGLHYDFILPTQSVNYLRIGNRKANHRRALQV